MCDSVDRSLDYTNVQMAAIAIHGFINSVRGRFDLEDIIEIANNRLIDIWHVQNYNTRLNIMHEIVYDTLGYNIVCLPS